jgi:hypothetical protein
MKGGVAMKKSAQMAAFSLIVTLVILFGGYLGFQHWNIQKPIEQAVRTSQGAKLVSLHLSPKRVRVDLAIKKGFVFSPEYRKLRERMEEAANDRILEIRLIDRRDAELVDAWERMAFGVNEGIARQEYTQIPETVESIARSEGILACTRMDERFVYVELRKGDRFLTQAIPLNNPESGVKTSG